MTILLKIKSRLRLTDKLWRPLLTITLCIMLSYSVLQAGDVTGIPGAYVDIGLGAGPMGLAGTNIVLVRDVYAILSNPAGLTSVNGQEMAFSMTKQFSLIPYNLVLYGHNLGKIHTVGVGFITAGDDVLRENTFTVTYARKVNKAISAGINLKYFHSSYGNNSDGEWIFEGGNRQVTGSANGFGFDMGIRGRIGTRTGYGLLLKDIYSSINYDASNEVGTAQGGSETVPMTMIMGLGFVASRKLTFEVNFRKALSDETNDRLYFGAERRILTFLQLRGGLSQNIETDETNRHYAAGLGVVHLVKSMGVKFDLDFAYIFNRIDNFYHIGIKVSRNK